MRYQKRNGNATWQPQEMEQMQKQLGLQETTAKILLSRGISPEKAEQFLCPQWEDLLDPFCFSHMKEIRRRVLQAIAQKEWITVYSDYDADGVLGATILVATLKRLGGKVDHYIPDRNGEGYGLNQAAVRKIAGKGGILFTVDCGITNLEEVRLANELGLDVIIADHHQCGELPETPYLLNPHRPGEAYPFPDLCGAGIAFQFARAMLGEKAADLIDLAGAATIGDMVPLRGENRVIAALGLEKLRNDPHPGFRLLAEIAGASIPAMDSYGVGFLLIPRINAAGRMAHAEEAFALFDAPSLEKARRLNQLNQKRQELQQKIIAAAVQMVETQAQLWKPGCIMICGEEFDKGVVGLAASHIAAKYHRPTVIFAKEDGLLVGSARSIPGINIYEALSVGKEYYLRFGGHAQAAGLTMKEEDFPQIQKKVAAYLKEKESEEVFLKTEEYDFSLTEKEATFSLAKELERLEPFGIEQEKPLFLMEHLQAKAPKELSGGKHLKFETEKGLTVLNFQTELHAQPGDRFRAVGALSINRFRGMEHLQLIAQTLERENAPKEETGEYFRMLPFEIAALGQQKKTDRFLNAHDFFEMLQACCKKSAFGTLVLIGSKPGYDVWRQWENRLDLPVFPCIRGNCGENMVALSNRGAKELRHFRQIFCIGAFARAQEKNAWVLWDEALLSGYQKEMEEFFILPHEMKQYQEAIAKETEKKHGYASIRDFLQQACGKTLEEKKMWLAVNVFCSEKLLEVKKNDKIFFNYREGDFCLEANDLYQAFQACRKGEIV